MEAFSCMDNVSFARTRITAKAIKAFAFLRRKLDNTGVVVNVAKTMVLPLKSTPRRWRRYQSLNALRSALQMKEG